MTAFLATDFSPQLTSLNTSLSVTNKDPMLSSPKAMPQTVLEELIAEKFTGRLTIQNPFDEFVNWQVYLGNGKIHFANSSVGNAKRINYMLSSIFAPQQLSLPEEIESDYLYISDLWRKKVFTFQQTRSILTQFTQEALAQALSLPKTAYTLDEADKLDSLFLNLTPAQAITPIEKKINYWWEVRSEISSPFQRPLVQDWQKLRQVLSGLQSKTSQDIFTLFHNGCKHLHCLYDIANQTQLSTLQLAFILKNLIKSGDITMLPYQEIVAEQRPTIMTVDDHPARQHLVQYTLEKQGYRVAQLNDPFKALAALQSQNPSMILINTELSEMDGYQLTSLCRKSPQLKTTPILLLTSQNSVVSRIKTKLCGANELLIYPFLPQDLQEKVKQYSSKNGLV